MYFTLQLSYLEVFRKFEHELLNYILYNDFDDLTSQELLGNPSIIKLNNVLYSARNLKIPLPKNILSLWKRLTLTISKIDARLVHRSIKSKKWLLIFNIFNFNISLEHFLQTFLEKSELFRKNVSITKFYNIYFSLKKWVI